MYRGPPRRAQQRRSPGPEDFEQRRKRRALPFLAASRCGARHAPQTKGGFAPKWVALSYFANDEAALIARCHRLTAEVNDWLSGRRGRDPVFDGAVGSLFRFYQIEPNSPYHGLEPASRHPYYVYARMIVETVGNRRIDALDGRDTPAPRMVRSA